MSYIAQRFALLILFAMGLVSLTSYGQVPQGQVLGIITDQSGAAIPGATLTLRDDQTGITHRTVSTASGDYTFLSLDLGTYTLTVQKQGFSTTISSGIHVQLESKKRVDVRLGVGAAKNQIVHVTGEAAKIDTDTAAIGTTLPERLVIGLPINGREFSKLALAMPGTVNVGTTGGALVTQFATAVQVGGTAYNKNAYTIDGADNTFNVWNGPSMNPSLDSIQEFRIDRSQFNAEYGRGGTEFELMTKSGTNVFHGALWEYLRNFAFDAGNYTTHKQDTLKQNQYGANLGGPIKRDKAFFFFNWEGQRQHTTVQPLGTVFTAQMRTGDLSQFPTPIIDPQTGKPFPNNTIPTNRLDTVALAYMNAMAPEPNLPGSAGGVLNNFIRPFVTSQNWDQYIARIDYQHSAKDSFFYRFSFQPRSGIDAPLAATYINSTEDMHFLQSAVDWTRAWSPKVLTQTRFGFHQELLNLQNGTVANLPTDTIKGFATYQPAQNRLPILSIKPYYTYAELNFPWRSAQQSYQLISNLTVIAGRHTVKIGFDGRYQRLNRKEFGFNVISMSFPGTYTGNGVGDFLLGLPFTASQSLPPTDRLVSFGDYAVFGQDDWNVTPSLTLNLGLRYEISTQPTDIYNRQSSFDPSLQKIVVAGSHVLTQYVPPPILSAYAPFLIPATETNLPSRTLVFGDHNDFAPRVGFAWRPSKDNKTVFRGGYGIYYLLSDGNLDAQGAVSAIPYGGSISATNTAVPSFTMDAPFGAGVNPPPPSSPFFIDPNRRDGYIQQASIGWERELPWGMVVEMDFQDQNSKKLESSWNLNQPRAGGSGPLQPRRPYPQFGPTITVEGKNGHARYDVGEVSVRKNSTHLTVEWNHSWAKNIGRISPTDPYHPDEFVGSSGFVPQLDKLSFVADLPFGRGRYWSIRQPVLDAVVGGWTISGIGNLYSSGQPLNVTWVGDPSNTGTNVGYPNQTCSAKLSHPTRQKWFNTSCFGAPTPGTFGSAQPGAVFGPSHFTYDAGLYKTFPIKKTNLQFRSEFYNVFNHPNLADPGLSANSAGFGQVLTKGSNPRVIQFALRIAF